MLLVREEYKRRRRVPVKNTVLSLWERQSPEAREEFLQDSLSTEPEMIRDSLQALDTENCRPLYPEGALVILGEDAWIVAMRFLDTERDLIRYSLVWEKDSRIVTFYEPDLMVCDQVHANTVREHYSKQYLERSLEDVIELKGQ